VEVYDTEEEQVAAIKRWWKENGTSTIAGVAIGIALIGGWNLWKSNVKEQSYQASALYDQLQISMSKENTESVQKLSEKLSAEHSGSAYVSYAALLLAKTKVQQNDLEAAKAILKEQMNSASSNELKNIARLRFIKLLYATGENEKGLQMIAEADQVSAKGFSASYDEMKGDLYVALDRLGEARTAYQSALRAGARSPLLQFKLDDIAATEIVTDQK
jgi:predicted negative regulator of RcsB-dependent stress response